MKLLSFLFFYLELVYATFLDEAGKKNINHDRFDLIKTGVTDFHLALVGLPEKVFFHEPVPGQGSLCFTQTDANIVAALNCRTGDLIWRQLFSQNETLILTIPAGDSIITVTDLGSVTCWAAQTGHALWQTKIDNEGFVPVVQVDLDTGFIYMLTADQLSKLEIATGRPQWSTSIENSGGSAQYITMAADTLLVASTSLFTQGSSSTSISRIKVNTSTGASLKLNSIDIESAPNTWSSRLDNCAGLLLQRPDEYSLLLTIPSTEIHKRIQISAPFSSFKAHCLLSEDHVFMTIQFFSGESSWIEIYDVDLRIHEISHSFHIPALGVPNAVTMAKSNDEVYIVRVSDDNFTGKLEIWSTQSHARVGSFDVHDIESTPGDGIVDMKAEVSLIPGSTEAIARVMFATSKGLFRMWRGSTVDWTRDEGLTKLTKMLLIELPDSATVQETVQRDTSALHNFYTRLHRHFSRLLSLLILPGSPNDALQQEMPSKDHFGLRQYALGFSDSTRIWALDTMAENRIAWSKSLPYTDASFVDAWSEGSRLSDGQPIVGILLERFGKTLYIQLEVMTGSITTSSETTVPHRPLSATTGNESSSPRGSRISLDATPHAIDATISLDEQSWPAWIFDAPPNEHIVKYTTLSSEVIASVGRVIGDRSVLYKYLDQEILSIISVDHEKSLMILRILHARSGKLLHLACHENVGTRKPIQLLMSENWIAYHYWQGASTQAFVMTIIELYQEEKQNLGMSAEEKLNILSRSFIYDYQISSMAVTTTKQGITSRDVVVALASGEVTTISRRLLDPRRPTIKLNANDKEEMLIPYEPVILNDHKSVLSHRQNVLGIKGIVTGPSLLESTALVCAFGLDIFFSRVTPSMPFDILSDSFSKEQIGISLFLLCAAIAFTRPIAASKNLKRRWIG